MPVVQWKTLTNLTATAATVTVSDPNLVTNSAMRFYRVLNLKKRFAAH
jgi:hypothetical protein